MLSVGTLRANMLNTEAVVRMARSSNFPLPKNILTIITLKKKRIIPDGIVNKSVFLALSQKWETNSRWSARDAACERIGKEAVAKAMPKRETGTLIKFLAKESIGIMPQ